MWWSERLLARLSALLPALLPALVLAGCGFQLQGSESLPPEIARTYISSADRYTAFHRALGTALEARGVEVTDDPAEASAVLDISRDETGQRVLSVSARNVPREFEIYYTVEYSVRTTEGTVLEPQRITLTQDYTWEETQVLGKRREEEMLRDALIRDLVRQVVRQLASID
ncbi:MAG TPA: LPS assembly lipoprotein LptE [Woeseiaceae bacterium]|nr:LPS assembly lipoprotein LptE [Woeseiaceae bacterium]